MAFDINGSVLAKVGTELRVDKGAINAMRLTAGGQLRRPVIPFFQGWLSGQGGTYGTLKGNSIPIDGIGDSIAISIDASPGPGPGSSPGMYLDNHNSCNIFFIG